MQEEEEEEKEQREERKSAPSAQRLRCGLAPSSQKSQPDPHIAFIYLRERKRVGV